MQTNHILTNNDFAVGDLIIHKKKNHRYCGVITDITGQSMKVINEFNLTSQFKLRKPYWPSMNYNSNDGYEIEEPSRKDILTYYQCLHKMINK